MSLNCGASRTFLTLQRRNLTIGQIMVYAKLRHRDVKTNAANMSNKQGDKVYSFRNIQSQSCHYHQNRTKGVIVTSQSSELLGFWQIAP